MYNARSSKSQPLTSPNTVPATKNESHGWSSSQVKRYLQCAEQQVSLPNLTKYCACHAKWISKISKKFVQNRWNVIYNARPIRNRSETIPSMIREWSEHETVSPQPASQPRLLFTPTTSILYWKIQHFAVRLSFQISSNFTEYCAGHEKATLELHQILRLPRKVNVMINPLHTWNVIYNARSNKSQPPTLPNTVPATKNESHGWSSSQVKRYLQCPEQQVPLPNLTKYSACHAKWFSKISKKFVWNRWNVIYNARPIRDRSETIPSMIRAWNRQSATRVATEVTFHAHREHLVLKNTTFRAPAIIPNFTKYCACDETCHLNFTKYCTCNEKWHLNVTKCCTCHEKKHLNFTNLLWLNSYLTLLTLLFLISSITWLYYYLTLLLLDSTTT